MSQPTHDAQVQALLDDLIQRLMTDLHYPEAEARAIAETARTVYDHLIPRPASEGIYGRHPAPPPESPPR